MSQATPSPLVLSVISGNRRYNRKPFQNDIHTSLRPSDVFRHKLFKAIVLLQNFKLFNDEAFDIVLGLFDFAYQFGPPVNH